MQGIKCKVINCKYYDSEDKGCLSDTIQISDQAICLTQSIATQECDHIIGTMPAWHRPGDASSDILIFQSNIDDEYADVTRNDIEELFDYCPKCGTKL